MSDHPEQSAGAEQIAAGADAGAGEGGSSSIPGHHPGALAAVASSAGLAGVGVKGVAGNWDPGNPEKDQSLLPNERKLRLGIDFRNDSKSCVCDIELGATVTVNIFETGAAPQADYEARILSGFQPGDGRQGMTGAAAQTGGEEGSGSSTRNAQDTHPGTDYTGRYVAECEAVSASGEKSCPASLPQGEETE